MGVHGTFIQVIIFQTLFSDEIEQAEVPPETRFLMQIHGLIFGNLAEKV
jgi:hypothetical protein